MKGKYFLDTNIFIYTFDNSSQKKQAIARNLVSQALEDNQGAISFQVVQEFFNTALRKFQTPLNYRDCAVCLRSIFAPLCEVFPTIDFYREALDIQERWQLSYYDSLIVTAALSAHCNTLFSEDFQHGMKIRNLTIENPFRLL